MLDGEQKILDFIRADAPAGGSEGIDRQTHLLEAGLIDSMGLFRLIAFIEETFGVSIPETDIAASNFESISKISQYVEELLHKGNRPTG